MQEESGAQDHRHAERACGPRDGQLAVLVEDRLHADRRQHDGRSKREPEHLDAEVAAGDVAQEARNDPPAAERLAVGAHRVFGPGSPGHVIECLRLQGSPGLQLQLFDRDRLSGVLPASPAR